MTLTQSLVRVRYFIVNTTFYPDLEITSWLNEGNNFFHSHKGITTEWELPVETDDYEWGFTGMLRVWKVKFTNSSDVTVDIDNDEYEVYNSAIILKTPLTEDGTLVIWGERLPTDVVNAGDSFEIPKEYEDALITYTLYKAEKQDQDPAYLQDFQTFLSYRQEYEKKSIKRNVRNKMLIERGW